MMTSTNSIEIRTIVCAICVILGVVVQYLAAPGIVSFVLGTLLIVVPTIFLTRFRVSLPQVHNGGGQASGQETARWVTIPSDKITETFSHATEKGMRVEVYSEFDEWMCKGCLRYVIMIPILVIGVCIGFSDPHIGAFFVNIVLLPWACLRMKYGSEYRKIYDGREYLTENNAHSQIKQKQDNLVTIYLNTTDLHPDMQFCLKHIKNKTYFEDVKIVYPIPGEGSGIICSMVSTAINNSVYPYSYYVLVFKGTDIEDSIINQFLECSRYNDFKGKVSVKDGNTVLVVTKYKSSRMYAEYETGDDDCDDLCQIIHSLNQLIEQMWGSK